MAIDTSKGKVKFFDDFTDKALDTTNWWTGRSDAGGTTPVVLLRHGGVVQMGVDATDDDVSSLTGNVEWAAGLTSAQGSGGPLTFEARLCLVTSLADGETFIGLSDDSATDEIPAVISTTDTYTATAATDFCGFGYNGAGTASWKAMASKNGTDVTMVACNQMGATTPVLLTYQTFKIVVNEDGDADFYIDGKWHVRLDNAITATVLMCPHIDIQSGGTARSMYIDYVAMEAGRQGVTT